MPENSAEYGLSEMVLTSKNTIPITGLNILVLSIGLTPVYIMLLYTKNPGSDAKIDAHANLRRKA